MKKVMFLATLMFASANMFGMDFAPNTESERKRIKNNKVAPNTEFERERIQNNKVAPNQKKAPMEKEFSKLMDAVKRNELDEVCKIIENHLDKSKIRDLLLYGKNKARLSKDQLEQVRRELYQNSYVTELVNLSDKNGDFPLFIAAQNGCNVIVEYLIEHGANINKADDSGRTPLCIAVLNGHKEIVEYLVERGADIIVTGCGLHYM